MKVRFWGTRGSIARPAEQFLRYGGNTSCVEVQPAAGSCMVIDCGTGALELGTELCHEGRAKRGALLISHTHWDHIQGFPFFAPFFVPGAEWDVYAPRGLARSLRETLAGQMQHAYFPITLDEFAATIRYHELLEGEFRHDGVRISTHYLDHPALTLGYRLEEAGAVLVYACDHEPVSRRAVPGPAELRGPERGHVGFLRDADLVIHDAQYTTAEYPGRIGWGHSTPDYAAAACLKAGARRLALTHHDPRRRDDDVDAIVDGLRDRLRAEGAALQVDAAAEGQTIELAGRAPKRPAARKPQATRPVEPGAAARWVVACGLGAGAEAVVRQATAAEALPLQTQGAFDGVIRDALADGRATVLIDAALAARHSGEIAGMQRAALRREAGPARVLLVAEPGNVGKAPAQIAAERLQWPFSEQYARTRIRAAVLRAECRWQPAPLPDDEHERLEALRSLDILDTAREERFDRIVRVAARALGTPAALITFIDAERQWFKSCVGVDATESSREEAFCAHAILQARPLIVPDALEDVRFADNPVVVGGPRVRFYAGCPIRSPRGLPLGSLCVIDSKPREIGDEEIELLRDLATLVEHELAAGWRGAGPPR